MRRITSNLKHYNVVKFYGPQVTIFWTTNVFKFDFLLTRKITGKKKKKKKLSKEMVIFLNKKKWISTLLSLTSK